LAGYGSNIAGWKFGSRFTAACRSIKDRICRSPPALPSPLPLEARRPPFLQVWTYTQSKNASTVVQEGNAEWKYYRHHKSSFLELGLVKVRVGLE
jgi:hypothetical protein